jgi:flagellar motility protein MotE (MotC chaperone)
MRYFYLFVLPMFVYANVVDCNKIFEERKSELIREIDKIDDRQQAFEALKSATNSLLDKKEQMISQKQAEVNATLENISQKEKNIEDLIKKNKKLLADIKEAKDDKIAQMYVKMKDGPAAAILENMEPSDACNILFNLQAKKMASIMAKMDPIKASKITQLLQLGPPFKDLKDNLEQ